MKLEDLDFPFPDELIATEPSRPSRVMWVGDETEEITVGDLLRRIRRGDILVVNDTAVLHRRVFSGDVEILFLSSDTERKRWSVLFPSKSFAIGARLELPEGRSMTLVQKGRPQSVETDQPLDEEYFRRVGELPLPPYIQKARAERHTVEADESWYQTAWASRPGSFAAPTASLHFSTRDLSDLRNRGVAVETVTLHVGLGTFLPVTAPDLNDHVMHSEEAEIHPSVWRHIEMARKNGDKVWALGTTVARTLESAALGKLAPDGNGGFRGSTDLLIQPGYQWQIVDRLITNFHQPRSTLFALVSAFAGLEKAKACYAWAIERKFKLFSYGDSSVWTR